MNRLTHHQQKLAVAKSLALLLDSAFPLPGTNQKIGLDPILGLIPGVGDFISFGISLYIVYLAKQIGVPRGKLVAMVFNLLAEALIGSIPLFGDAWDIFWKANMRNIELMEKHLEQHGLGAKRSEAAAPGTQTIDIAAEPSQTDKS